MVMIAFNNNETIMYKTRPLLRRMGDLRKSC